MEPGREGATLGDRRAEFDNTHYVLLSGSYVSPAGKAYGMFLPSGQNSSCGKAAAFYFFCSEIASAAHLLNYFGGTFAI